MVQNALRQVRHGFNRPFMVMFETTLHCNMKCGYCAIWQNQQPEDRAVRDRVFARMDEAADFGVFAWSFSGGEPLMNPNVPDYIAYAARKGFYTSMPTNGLALKKYAEACAQLDQLEVSIDTLDREKFAQAPGHRRPADDSRRARSSARAPATTTPSRSTPPSISTTSTTFPRWPRSARSEGCLLHTEAVHNVVRTTWKTEDVELEGEALDTVAAYLTEAASSLQVRALLHRLLPVLSQRWVHQEVSLPLRVASRQHAARWVDPVSVRVRQRSPRRAGR